MFSAYFAQSPGRKGVPRPDVPVGTSLRRLAGGLPLLLVAVMSAGCGSFGGVPGPEAGKAGAISLVSSKDVLDRFNQLKLAPEAPMTGYSREQFPHWDTNKPEHGFGSQFASYAKCTTREVMLLRDASGPVSLDPQSCQITVGNGGGWRDHYGVMDRKTGQLRPYKFITDPKGVDAEHIVPLAEAWRSGAAGKTVDDRRNLANDAINLVASDPSANRTKGDQDPSDYLPPGEFHCPYVDHYVQIKLKYGLTIDDKEQKALRSAIDDCTKRGEFK